MQAIQDAIDSFNPATVIVANPVADLSINLSEALDIDVSTTFSVGSGNPITVTVDANSNSTVASANISGNTVTIEAEDIVGTTEITLRGTAGDESAIDKFIVTVVDPNTVAIYTEDFEAEPSDWTYANTVTGWRWGAASDFGSSQYWTFDEHTNFMGANSDEAGSGATCQDMAISPAINLAGYESLTLDFNFCFLDDGSDDYASLMTVSYRTSASSDWVEIVNFDDVDSRPWIAHQAFIPAEAAVDGMQLGFFFDDFGNWAYGGGFDDVVISGSNGNNIETGNITKDFSLSQNYPNPFNPSTSINFQLANVSDVKLSVFNAKGEIVLNNFSKEMTTGNHTIKFDGSSLNSGVYYYTINVNGISETKKMMLIK